MRINKIYNNNVVLSIDERGHEIIVMGRGLAFQKRQGDEIDETTVEKVFAQIDKQMTSKLITLLDEIPIEFFTIAEEIIREAKIKMGKKINDKIIISLTDHIYFAIKRYNEGTVVRNGLLWEIKRLYPDEYELGKKAISLINERYNTMLPDDEAAFIALHLVNGQLDEELPTIVAMTKIMKGVLEIVKLHFMVQLNEESLSYFRFVTHLKFFAQRLLKGNFYQDGQDQELFLLVKKKYPNSYSCTEKIRQFVANEFGYELSSEEMLYITVHLERLIKSTSI